MQVSVFWTIVRNTFELLTDSGVPQAYYPLYVEPSQGTEEEMDEPGVPACATLGEGASAVLSRSALGTSRTITSDVAIKKLIKDTYSSLATTKTPFKVPPSPLVYIPNRRSLSPVRAILYALPFHSGRERNWYMHQICHPTGIQEQGRPNTPRHEERFC